MRVYFETNWVSLYYIGCNYEFDLDNRINQQNSIPNNIDIKKNLNEMKTTEIEEIKYESETDLRFSWNDEILREEILSLRWSICVFDTPCSINSIHVKTIIDTNNHIHGRVRVCIGSTTGKIKAWDVSPEIGFEIQRETENIINNNIIIQDLDKTTNDVDM